MKEYLKRNKPRLFLPLVLVPFIVLIFYILGGGTRSGQAAQNKVKNEKVSRANYRLPEADRSISIKDKMENALENSREMTEAHDYRLTEEKDSTANVFPDRPQHFPVSGQLKELIPPENPDAVVSGNLLSHIRQQEEQAQKDLQKSGLASGQKIKNLSKPHPGGQTLKANGTDQPGQSYGQDRHATQADDSLLWTSKEKTAQNKKAQGEEEQSFTLEKQSHSGFTPGQTVVPLIRAEVYETATVVTGNRVKLRLMEDAWLSGTRVPANTFLYGTCEVSGERLLIRVRQILAGEKFVPVAIIVCDLDGLAGLYVPGNALRKAAGETGSSVNISSLTGEGSTPLAYAGLQAADHTARNLLKIIRLKKVTVRKNTLVYLVNKTR